MASKKSLAEQLNDAENNQTEKKTPKAKNEIQPQNPVDSYSGSNEKETRNANVHVLLKPSIYVSLRKIATVTKQSIGDLIEAEMTEFVKSHQDEINIYDRTLSPILGEPTYSKVKKTT